MTTHRFILVAVAALGLAAPAAAQANGQVLCEVTENGGPASGTIVLLQGETRVAEGTCGKPVAALPGLWWNPDKSPSCKRRPVTNNFPSSQAQELCTPQRRAAPCCCRRC